MKIMNPASLCNHPLNVRLFGEKDDADEVTLESIRLNGVNDAIEVLPAGRKSTEGKDLPEYTIVKGHRRRRLAVMAGVDSVPVVVRDDLVDPEDIERHLIESNDEATRRVVSKELKARQFKYFRELEQQKRRDLRDAGTPMREDSEDYERPSVTAAREVGMNVTQAINATKVIDAIDEAESDGDDDRAAKIREALSKGTVNSAMVVADTTRKTPQAEVKKKALEYFHHIKDRTDQIAGYCNRMRSLVGESEHEDHIIACCTQINKMALQWKGKA